ncbi:MAG: GNAT family N-acetyltransferase [Acidobacteria bacterium]|nr:GNAT family N-acetyltransferase [Acidobacteriota bacterium]MCA1639826.1 GNAT family N-acetyltransferase [Acidobacteriota bacterium]
MRGKKVFLRPPKVEDSAEYIQLAKQSEKFHRGLIKMAKTQKDFNAFLERSVKEENECFLVCRTQDKAIVGMINLSQIIRGVFQNAYLGYGLGVKFTGKGLMTEAVELILRFAFKDLKLHRIEANVQPDNAASINVLKRTGFTKEGFSPKYLKVGGRWRDHERWAIIAEDWRKGK